MKFLKKIISVLLAFLLTFLSLSVGSSGFATTDDSDEIVASLPFVTISDIHYYPQSYTGNQCEAWQEFCTTDSKQYEESEALVYAALDSIMLKAEEMNYKYLLIPGDLTKDSEYEAHIQLAAILENFEKETGIEVFVINGNHDINVYDACTFENGVMEQARSITQSEFREVYANLGYDHAISEYKAADGSYQNGLSYAADLDENYRLIVVDSCLYDPDVASKQQTGGMITQEAMAWVQEMAKDAENSGRTPIVMIHHSVSAHMKIEPSVTFAFCIDDYQWVAESFADAGIHYAFTGHQHTNDISSVVSDSGNVLYDCEVGALTGFPNYIRECVITTYGNGESEMEYSTFDVDTAHPVTVNGKTYEQPFSTASFAIQFGGRYSDDGYADMEAFFMGIIKNYLLPYIDDINEAGGINEFLKTMNIDLEEIIGSFLAPYIGDGIGALGVNIFSVDNIMWFIEDLFSQIEELYIKDPNKLIELLESVVHKLVSLEVSSLPCTKFIDTYNFGDATTNGTLGDFVLSVMYYWYTGNEDCSDDTFVLDVISNFENGELVNTLIDTLLDIILNDLIDEAILSKLKVNLGALFGKENNFGKSLGCSVDHFVNSLLKGNTSYMNLVNTVLGIGILPYESIQDIIDSLMEEYITESQIESLGYTFAYCISDFVTDVNPKHLGDNNVSYSTVPVEPEVSQDNYRLPAMISVTPGADATSANISWFSKDTVKGSDIEIYKADNFTAFTGTPAEETEFSMDITSEEVTVSYPGIDIGITGFFYYDFTLNRHIVKLSGLEENTTYYYRVGDAEKGWWSETGSVTTQDGSDNVTFINVTDSQSQTPEQYERGWANVTEKAFELYPETDLILHSGDMVDNPKNVNHYQWLLNSASGQLMNTYLLTTSGNHENFADNALADKFVFSSYPEQDTATGVYYSYDYNNVHFIVLNSNDLNDNDGLSDEQIEWLKADAAASDADWKIVSIHKAVYSNGSHYDDDDVCAIREQLSVLMPELDIDLVFQGHDHVYMRTYALDSNLVTDIERVYLTHNGKQYATDEIPTGTSYVICGTSGVKIYNQKDAALTDELFPRAEQILDVDAAMFSAVEIENDILYFDAYTVDGENVTNVDSFAIRKDIQQGDYAGDCPEVSADEKNSIGATNPLEKLIEFFKKIVRILTNIFTLFSF